MKSEAASAGDQGSRVLTSKDKGLAVGAAVANLLMVGVVAAVIRELKSRSEHQKRLESFGLVQTTEE